MDAEDTDRPTGASTVVHLRGAVALLGRFPALAGVDLDVERRRIVLLRGPNGAGKTTLLRTLAGLVPVSEGTAVVLGVDLVRDRTAVRHRVGLLAHATGLYDDLTVADNVRFWARAARAEQADADVAMARLGLDGRLRHVSVGRLSTGQRRRTSLACLIARRPELWLMDEPHAGLDQDGRDVVDDLIRDASAAGATIILSSHELDRSLDLADEVITISGGIAIREPVDGSPGEGSSGTSGAAAALPGPGVRETGVTVPPDETPPAEPSGEDAP